MLQDLERKAAELQRKEQELQRMQFGGKFLIFNLTFSKKKTCLIPRIWVTNDVQHWPTNSCL